MRWVKKGLVYRPDGSRPWAAHSALQPTPVVLGDVIRVFIGCRDMAGRSSVGFVDVAASDPSRVLEAATLPALSPGPPGSFDQDGVVPCAVARIGDSLRLYYAGYRRGRDVRFRAFAGVAESSDGGRGFTRVQPEPVMPPTASESLFRAVHSIRLEQGRWRVWYGAGSGFIQGSSKTLPVYDIRYTESPDGLAFPETGTVCLALRDDEHRLGRPFVTYDREQRYEMFYGIGTETLPFRLGYARSADGIEWTRHDDEIGLATSPTGWDSAMTAYPAVIDLDGRRYLFYNGNDYGRGGFGYAVLAASSRPGRPD